MIIHYNKFEPVVNDNYERRLFLKSIEDTIQSLQEKEEINKKVLFGKNSKQEILTLIEEKNQLRNALYEV